MKDRPTFRQELETNGFSVIENLFSGEETAKILEAIEAADQGRETFRKSRDLFAIRQFLREVPSVSKLILTEKLQAVIRELMDGHAFVVKSIYFDKPESSNWVVAWHQDLTISVDQKTEMEGFGPWTRKQNQFAVQPPVHFLENILTIRIHLDDTDEHNGALKVIPGSHLEKVCRPETLEQKEEKGVSCPVKRGGIMLMKPLTFHSSGRTTNGKQRRVIHLELANQELPAGLHWSERMDLNLFS
jgi:ectoine hydroxylase-related dioxygenase (phytanoyl-CoA dioxygenase family)